MTLSPVIERELRVALRKKDPRKSRMSYCALGVGVGALGLILSPWGGSADILHGWLFNIGLYIAVIQTLQATSDLFTQERQSQTFGLLFLAGLNMRELFGGKVLSAFLISFTNLITLAPCMALAFLTGGVSFSLFIATLCCLPVMLIFTLSVSCLASALCEEDSTARVVAVGIAAALSAVPLLACEISSWSSHALGPGWRALSPAWGPWLIHRQAIVEMNWDFWISCGVTLVWSGLLFGLAAVAVRQVWQRDLAATAASAWAVRAREWMFGNSAWRRKRALWFDRNPFVWLASRSRQPERLAWAVVITVAASVALCCWALPRPWLKVWIFYVAAILANFGVEWIAAYTAAKTISDARRDNTVELILTTPLGVDELISGQMRALQLQFQPIFYGTLAFNLAMMLGGFFIRKWNWRAVCVYLVIWTPLLMWSCRRTFRSALKALWAGLNTGRPALASTLSLGFYRFWWWNMINIWNLVSRGSVFPSGSVLEFCLVTAGVVIGIAIYLGRPVEEKRREFEQMLSNEFRYVATEPLPDPNDPRLKKWNVHERFFHDRPQLIPQGVPIP